MNRMRVISIAVLAALTVGALSSAHAAAPDGPLQLTATPPLPLTFLYQGQLRDATGAPMSGSQTVQLDFFVSQTASTPLITKSASVTVTAGQFSMIVDFTTALDYEKLRAALRQETGVVPTATGKLYVQTTVNGTALNGANTRQELASVPSAMTAIHADTADYVRTALVPPVQADSTVLSAGAVTSTRIRDGQVNNADLADGAVTAAKIQAQSVTPDRVVGIPGVAFRYTYSAGGTTLSTSGGTAAGSVQITAPVLPASGGQVVVEATFLVDALANGGKASWILSTTSGSDPEQGTPPSGYGFVVNSGTADLSVMQQVRKVFTATPNTPVTFYLNGRSTVANCKINRVYLTATYYPTTYGDTTN